MWTTHGPPWRHLASRPRPVKTRKIPTLKQNRRGYAYAYFNGRQEWFGRHDDPAAHQHFQEQLQRWLANGGEDPDADRSDLTVADLVARFLEHAETYYRRADGTPTGTIEAFVYAFKPLIQLFATTRAERVPGKATSRSGTGVTCRPSATSTSGSTASTSTFASKSTASASLS
jgi:hypothetical protein